MYSENRIDRRPARNGKRLTMEQGLDWAAKWKQVNDALGKVSADCHYDEWIKIGMAIHSWLPDSVGMELWNKWSKTSKRYPKEGIKTIRTHWRSFKPGGGITIGTLFGKAGFKKEELLDYGMPIELDMAVEAAAEWDDAPEEDYDFAPWDDVNIYDLPEGLAKELFNFLYKKSPFDIPLYALSMAIVAAGFIKRNFAQTSTELRTNLMAIMVGPSGTGKSRSGNNLKKIMISEQLNEYVKGKLGSVEAIEEFLAINDHNSSLFQIIDEIKVEFEDQADRNKTKSVRLIKDFKLEVFGCPCQYESVLTKVSKGKAILYPFFSSIGFATPEIFSKFMMEDLDNGYFARHLLFHVQDIGEEKESDVSLGVPKNLTNYIKRYKYFIQNSFPKAVAQFDEQAEELITQLKEVLEKNRAILERNEDPYGSFFKRAIELVRKIALILSEPKLNDDEVQINEHSTRTAIGIVVHSIKNWIHVARHYMSGNLTEAMSKDVYLKITEMTSKIGDHWILYRDLSRKGKCQQYKRKDLKETIARLQEEEKIDVVPNQHKKGSVLLRSRIHGIPQTDPNQLITNKRSTT